MKILHLPHNIASLPTITVTALNKIEGVEAKCLTLTLNQYQSYTADTIFLPLKISKRKPIKWLLYKWSVRKKIKELIDWADVLHYTWSPVFPNNDDLEWAYKLKKPLFIEWVGSDIRNPNYLRLINPYYDKVFDNGYEYAGYESHLKSTENQQLFSKYNAIPLTVPELKIFIDRELLPYHHTVYQRVDLSQFIPEFPKKNNSKPLIIHSPTAKIAKGTDYIIAAIDELKKTYDIDFKLLHNMPRSEVQELVKKADIFVDQLICGSYGMAATEAMSYGKPVMCYIMPQVFESGLSLECPIVNANPENFKEKLRELVENPQLRYNLGKRSRTFAEDFHDADKISHYLVSLYGNALKKMQGADL